MTNDDLPAAQPISPPALRPDYQWVGSVEDDAVPASPFQVKRLLATLLRFWWLPVATLVIGLGAAVGYVLWSPPTFVSRGYLWEAGKLRLPESAMFTEDVQNFVGTQTELLQSTTLRDLALERLRTISNSVAVPLGKDGEPLLVPIRVAQASRSSVFTLEATSSSAAYTQNYLEALMNVYLEYKRNVRMLVSGDTLASLTEQVQKSDRELKAQQDILTAFEQTNNLAMLQEEGTVLGGYLARLKTQLADLELENKLLQATPVAQGQTDPVATNGSTGLVQATTPTGEGFSSGASAERQTASKEIELLKMQRERLSHYLRPKHPKIVKLDTDIERAEKLVEIFRHQDREQLAASLQSNQLKRNNLLDSIKEWEGKVVHANRRIAEAERLKIDVQRAQNVCDRLNLLVQNVGLSRNLDQETLSILQHASPAKRTYARETSLLALGGGGGLGLGLGIIVLIALRDDRISSLVEINQKLGQVIVGQVPQLQNTEQNAVLPLLEMGDARHAYAESFRSLRSALLFMATENERPQVVLITSAQPNEGKSTVAANLARVLALGGSRVMLIDADLRKGVLHDLLGLQRGPGLAEALRDPDDLEKIVQTNSLPNLTFISSGKAAENSGDLFLGPAFDKLLTRLRQQYDYVIIDSSPVFAADDATTLAPKVDGTLFVVRSRFSRIGPAREALELLYQRKVRVLGVVFNQADSSARSYYYYKYADYYGTAKTS